MSNSADKLKHQIENLKNHKLSTKSLSCEAHYFGETHSQACSDSKELHLKGHKSLSKQMQSSTLSSNGFATSAEKMLAYSIDYSNLSAAVATDTAVRFYESVTHLTERKECTFQQEFPKKLRSKEKMQDVKEASEHMEQSMGEVHSSQSMTTADCGQLSLKRLKVEAIETNHLVQQKVTQQAKSTYNMEQWESGSSVSSSSGDNDESERNCSSDDRLKSLWNSAVQPNQQTIIDIGNRIETWNSSADFEMKHTSKHTQLPNPVREEATQAENSQEKNLLNSLDFHNALMNFNSYRECSNEICRLQTARAHFHCYDFACLGRKVLIRQKDLLRHIKWHRRQNKSLAHGFLRYSAGDECGGSAAGAGGIAAAADSCQYRRRQTHYHCVQGDCARVCVSLGAAKLHANDHKIAAMTTAAAERSFRRYTSKENCSVEFCIFSGRKVAHFHCAHANCQFTAKTKTDLEKHRAYHQSESMQYARAADSRRPERSEACAADIPQPRAARRQSEQQQRQQQQQQRQHEQCDCKSRADNYDKSLSRCGSKRNSMDARGSELQGVDDEELQRSAACVAARTTSVADEHKMRRHSDSDECESNNNNSSSSRSSSSRRSSSTSSNIAANSEEPACSSKARHLAAMEYLQKMLQQQQQLLLLQQQQELLLLQQQSNKETSAEEAKQSTRTAVARTATTTRACAAAKDLTAVDCAPHTSGLSAAAAANFYQQLASATAAAAAAVDMSAVGDVAATLKSGAHPVQITSIDGFFNRKRGRPPKNRFVEVYKNTQQSPQAIFTSFKLEKHGLGNAESLENTSKVETFSATSATNERNHLSHIQKEQQLLQALAPNLEQQLTQLPFHLGRDAQRISATMASSSARAKMTSDMATSYSKKNQIGIDLSNSSISSEEFNMLRFHQFIEDEFDCRIERCRLRKLHPHLHCKNCQQQVSPLDLKTHACAEALTLRPRAHEFAEGPASVARAEKVSVVRAAGTFYPENSSSNNDVSKPAATSSEDAKTTSNNGLTGAAPKSAASPSSCKSKRRRTEAAATEVAQKPSAQQQRPRFLAPTTAAAAVARVSSEFDADMPQDLSVHAATTTTAVAVDEAAQVTAKAADDYTQQQQQLSLHFQQLISLYQQQQQQQQMLYNATGMPAYAAPTLVPHQLPATTALLAEMSPLLAGAGGATPLNFNLVATLFETFSNAAGRQLSAAPATERRAQTKPQSALPANQKNHSSTAGLLHKLKDDRIPTGYLKFRFNEDCGFPKCGYRNHQSHFHCNRVDCHYSFCDKTRFVQHTARHERLDTLMGEDFLQYRANMNCGHNNCPYLRTDASTSAAGAAAKKSSHFHCRKCEFICSDTNKVVAHRRLHHKMEYIRLAGFRKVACNENCKQTKGAARAAAEKCAKNSGAAHRDEEVDERCPYSMKHTHYHCLVCDCSVLSRAQLATHKHKITATMTAAKASPTAALTTS